MGRCYGDSQAPLSWWNLGPVNVIPDPKMSTRDWSHPSSANQNSVTVNPRRLFPLNKNQKKHVDNAVDLWFLAKSIILFYRKSVNVHCQILISLAVSLSQQQKSGENPSRFRYFI